MFSKKINNLQESATLKINAIVNQLKKEGKEVYNLTTGEPDFNVSQEVKNAVIEALNKNLSKYTPTPGILELRELIAKKTNAQQNLPKPWLANNVMVSNGGKQAIFNTILALVDKEDEVIIPSPYWLSYPEMVKVAEGTVCALTTSFESNYKITPSQLKEAISDRTKLFILNSPSNPTGALYTQPELKALGEVLKKHPQVYILSDEIYDLIDYNNNWSSFLKACPELQNRTITINGLSKSGAMTGWRIGWSVCSEFLAQKLNALQGHSTSGICSLSQAAGVAALSLPDDFFFTYLSIYQKRKSLGLEILNTSSKIKTFNPAGAFYFFLDLSKILPTQNASYFCEKLLESTGVAAVSAVDFGYDKGIRLSFATSEDILIPALSLLVDFVERFQE